MNIVITVRGASLDNITAQHSAILESGFNASAPKQETNNSYIVWAFQIYAPFENAHRLPRHDNRWSAANSFFQAAERMDGMRGAYAVLSNDWASFGYLTHTLAEYIAQERQRQLDYIASARVR